MNQKTKHYNTTITQVFLAAIISATSLAVPFILLVYFESKSELAIVKPIIVDWQPEVEFVTVAPVKRIGDLEIGQVTVRRTDNNFSLPVLAIPFQEIPTGTKVKIIEIENVTDSPFRRSLIMLKPNTPEKKE